MSIYSISQINRAFFGPRNPDKLSYPWHQWDPKPSELPDHIKRKNEEIRRVFKHRDEILALWEGLIDSLPEKWNSNFCSFCGKNFESDQEYCSACGATNYYRKLN